MQDMKEPFDICVKDAMAYAVLVQCSGEACNTGRRF